MEVGIRELKAHLSRYVERAAAGEVITVTDRGKPVARLMCHHAGDEVERGIDEGWIEPPRRDHLNPFMRRGSSRSVLDVLDEDRG